MIRAMLLPVLFASRAIAGEATIQPGDTVKVRAAVPQEEASISNFYLVDDVGRIDLPYIGKTVVKDMTVAEAEHVIDKAYLSEQVFSHPAATISIGGPNPFVAIEGQVVRPGQVAIRSGLTLLQTITEAGGFTDSADQKTVKLERAASGTVSIYNVTKIIRHPDMDILLHAEDKILVGAQK